MLMFKLEKLLNPELGRTRIYLSNLSKKTLSNHISYDQITWSEHSEEEKNTRF